jgi:hypothetical protein
MKGGEMMATAANISKKSLKLELDGGIVDGKQKVASKLFTNVKTDATDENLNISGQAIAGLQEKGLLKVKKVEEYEFSEV